jgi:hypothetical protein
VAPEKYGFPASRFDLESKGNQEIAPVSIDKCHVCALFGV